ncbi:acyl-CoA synthetase [Prescottella equi]|uniref:Acyl-CoA ligase/synthetase n=1 Tax=Rhodococcus hoagii (strain 103S) TaxID=685727 RepID=A0A3S5YCP9_RHOH1|nr:acyl-CoA synthetase [Prescottella equi]MDP8016803.1 acyl-CoA synthetase [Prescottella equi]CBH50351.1 putative acyl-CoA ligase/synthetase [Prescottella equi 103S]
MTLNLADLTEAVIDAVPDKVALVCGSESRTFAEFDAAANRIAHHLAEQGVGPGDHVGLHARNSLEFVESLLGCLKIRAVPVNVNFRYVDAELTYLYNDAKLATVIADGEFSDVIADVLPKCPELRHIVLIGEPAGSALADAAAAADVSVVDYHKASAAQSADRDFPERSADDLYVIYTGGTTGMPKGVMWRHEDFYHAALAGGAIMGGDPILSPAELGAAAAANQFAMTYLVTAPLMHGAASYSLFTCMFMGSKQVLMSKYDPVEALELVDRHKINTVMVVGDAIARPLADAIEQHGDRFDLSSLWIIGSGGALWSASVRGKLNDLLPNVYLRDAFGSSESGNDGELKKDEDGLLRMPPSPKARVVDTDFSTIEPGSDNVGYLARAGHVPLGYFGDPEKTAATFPVVDGVRLSVLGDLARVEADGTIVVLGRGSSCINTGGEKVYAEEVEEALKSHPGVLDALVAGIPDPMYGQRVSAVISAREGVDDLDEDDVIAHCRTKIAGYKVPRTLVVVPEVVRSPAGKADYRWAKATLESASQ